MKIKLNDSAEVEVKTLRMHIAVDYKDLSANFPLAKKDPLYGRRLSLDIDIETGIIQKWPQGCTGELYTKVVDTGFYYLLDENKDIVTSIENGYVPNKLIPPKDGYGDYIHLYVDENGKITNWYENPDLSEFSYEYKD